MLAAFNTCEPSMQSKENTTCHPESMANLLSWTDGCGSKTNDMYKSLKVLPNNNSNTSQLKQVENTGIKVTDFLQFSSSITINLLYKA